jgi:hypothetical protein
MMLGTALVGSGFYLFFSNLHRRQAKKEERDISSPGTIPTCSSVPLFGHLYSSTHLSFHASYQGNTELKKLIPPSMIPMTLLQFAVGMTRAAKHLLCLQPANTTIAILPSQIISLQLTPVKKDGGCSQRRSDRGAMEAEEHIPRPRVLVIAMRSS